MNSLSRIQSIALKEFRLNTRFPVQYFINNLATPIKTSLLMYLIYRGFLSGSEFNVGVLNKSNYQIFVLIGTTCHSLFSNCQNVFRGNLTQEKYWQTLTATFASPASSFELISGYILGNSVHLFIALTILLFTCLISGISLYLFALSLLPILLLSLMAFGLGIIGATISLVDEGKSFVYDYSAQALIFLSCFYYPVDTLPKSVQGLAGLLPTYQASQMIQRILLGGFYSGYAVGLIQLTVIAFASIIIPTIIFDKSIRRFGIVGY